MSRVVIVNGPPAVGKTTVSPLVAHALPKCVCIHGDHVRAFSPDDKREFLGGGSTYRAAAALTVEYLRMGATTVIFECCFLRPSHLRHFSTRLHEAADPDVFLFTLWAPLDLIQRRERARLGQDPLGAAVAECWHEIAANRPKLGHFLEITHLDPDQVADQLLTLLESDSGRLR